MIAAALLLAASWSCWGDGCPPASGPQWLKPEGDYLGHFDDLESAMAICQQHGYWKEVGKPVPIPVPHSQYLGKARFYHTYVWAYAYDWRDCGTVELKWQKREAARRSGEGSQQRRFVTSVAQGRTP